MTLYSLIIYKFIQLFINGDNWNHNNQCTSGIYVYKYYARQVNSNKLIKLLPDDSIFYYNTYAIEKLIKIQDFLSDNTDLSIEKGNGYYFIDFKKNRFFKIDSLKENKPIKKPSWENIDKKQLGLQLHFQYYSGVKYAAKDTLIQNKKYKLVRYISQQANQQKGALISVYLQQTLGASLIPNLENKFQGRVKAIFVSYPNNQGEVRISLDLIRNNASSQMIHYIQNVVSTLGD